MNKFSKRIISLVIALLMIISTIVGDVRITPKAYDPNRQESLTYSVKINDVPIKDVEYIHDGDSLDIEVEWILPDGVLSKPYTKSIDLSPMTNVTIPEGAKQKLSFGGGEVGYVEIKENKINLYLTDDDFLTGKETRSANGNVSGTIDCDEKNLKNGDEVEINLGADHTYKKKYDDGTKESGLKIDKKAGDISYSGGKWIQTYSVDIYTHDGDVTISSLSDKSGDFLSNMSSITITANSVGNLNKNVGDTITFDDLENVVIKSDEKLSFTYTMEVDDNAFKNDASYDSGKNELEASYISNKNKTNSISGLAALQLKKIGGEKKPLSTSTDDEQTWEITINLGDLIKSGKSFDELITSVTESLGAGLTSTDTLSASDFEKVSDGVYKATFKTSLTDEYKKMESTTVTNTVNVTTTYGSFPINGQYTTTGIGGATIEKDYVQDSFDETEKTLDWKVTLKDVAPTNTKVNVEDVTTGLPWTQGKTQGSHTWNHTLYVNGNLVLKDGVLQSGNTISIGGSTVDILSTKNEWGGDVDYTKSDKVFFTDEFIVANNGADIVLDYTTDLTSVAKADMQDKIFYNKATLSYVNAKGDTKSKYDDAQFEKTFSENALSKSGVVDDTTSTIEYTLTVSMSDLDYFKSADNTEFVINDYLPEGLKFVDGSVKVVESSGYTSDLSGITDFHYYPAGAAGLTNNHYWSYYNGDQTIVDGSKTIKDYLVSFEPSYDASARLIQFTYPVDENYDILMGFFDAFPSNFDKDNHFVKITYKAQVADMKSFIKNGENLNVINTADYSYKDEIKEDKVEVKHTLKVPNLVNKASAFKEDLVIGAAHYNGVAYTIDVNAGAYDLSDGKLIGTDKLGSALSYDLASVVVNKVDASGTKTPLSQGLGENDYSFTYDKANNSLTFSLPDSMHLEITYNTIVNLYNGYNSENSTTEYGELDPNNSANTFSLKGLSNKNASKSINLNKATTKTAWTAKASTGGINIKKYWTDGGQIKAVTGSIFKIYKCTVDGNSITYDETKDEFEPTKIFKIINDDGVLNVSGLLFDTVYALVEVSPGTTGTTKTLVCQTEPYYFVIPGSKDVNVPDSVKTFASGSYLYYENEEGAALSISKKKSGKTTELAGAKLALYDATTNTKLGDWDSSTEPVTFEIGTATDFSKNKLKEGEYVLIEENPATGCSICGDGIKFKIEKTTNTSGATAAKITILGKTGVEAPFEIKSTDLDGEASLNTDANELTLFNDELKLYLKKTDNSSAANLVGNAKFVLKKGTEELGNVTSSASGVVQIPTDKIDADGTTVYSLTETSTPTGYQTLSAPITFTVSKSGDVTIVSGNATAAKYNTSDDVNRQINVVNNKLVSVEGYKVWDDADDADKIRPNSIEIILQRKIESDPEYTDVAGTTKNVVAGTEGKWEFAYNNLPAYDANGKEYIYRVYETTVPSGYSSFKFSVKLDSGKYVITNVHEEVTKIGVIKVWDDANDQDKKRPTSISVQLYADGEAKGEAVTLNAANEWSYVWTDLAKKKSGTDIVYTVKETGVPQGYTTTTSTLGKKEMKVGAGTEEVDAYTITNKYTPGKTTKKVEKVWVDDNNQDKIRPDYVEVQLYADGVKKGDVVKLESSNSWTYQWTELDEKKSGNLIDYTVEEVNVPQGYISSSKVLDDGTTVITNTHESVSISLSATKIWSDNNDKDKLRTSQVEVQLYADGVKKGDAVKLDASNNWKYTWAKLAKYNNGSEIKYTFKEVSVPKGYEAKYATDTNGNVVITNIHKPKDPTTQSPTTTGTTTEKTTGKTTEKTTEKTTTEITTTEETTTEITTTETTEPTTEPPTTVVKTGDESRVLFAFVIMLVALSGMTVIYYKKKKKDD